MEQPKSHVASLLFLPIKLTLAAIAIAVPLLGVWVASSLAAYLNGPVWLAVLSGLLFFPILPLAWDAWSNVRRRKKGARTRRFLTFFDRLILRTLAINLAFAGTLLATHPKSGFAALSARGDWMLEGRSGELATRARTILFAIANQMEWVYLAANHNPYEQYADEEPPANPDAGTLRPEDIAGPGATASASAIDAGVRAIDSGIRAIDAGIRAIDAGVHENDAGSSTTPSLPDAAAQAVDAGAAPVETPPIPTPFVWPFTAQLHDAVKNIPPDQETSLETVAGYIAAHEPNLHQRVKAIHDYIADRIYYDDVALARGEYPPQDGPTVFRTKKGVCAGYSRLFVDMTKAIGVKSVYISGEVRDRDAEVMGESHAWNAVELDGYWYLVDVTWDSARMLSGNSKNVYGTEYFLTPPEVFGLDHFPGKDRWQLRDKPLTRGEFIRQPMVSPRFHQERLSFIAPDRSQVDAENGAIEVILDNPQKRWVLSDFIDATDRSGRDSGVKCGESSASGVKTQIRCRFPASGVFNVRLYTGDKQYGQFAYVGQIRVTNK